jgi:DNA-binding transcriptional ArsR family regulator
MVEWKPTEKMTTEDQLSATLFALSDPTRRGILARLAAGEASVTELAAPFEMSFAAVSKHVKVLETAGLVSRGRDAQWRPCHLDARPLQAAAEWLEEYRRFWDRNLDSLGDYLETIQSAQRKPASNTKRRRK